MVVPITTDDHINVTFRVPYGTFRQLYGGYHGIMPAGLGKNTGDNVGNIKNRRRQKDLFDALEVSLDHQQPDQEGAAGHGNILADVEELHAAGNADELRHDVAEVDHNQQQHQQERHAQPKLFADQVAQALAGHRPHARAHFLHHQQSHSDGNHGPQQGVSELGSGIGVGENAARIVINIGGNKARPQHGEEEQYADSPALEHAVRVKISI